ncbi:MAG: phospholipid carrier-dependent glycosyltransferase [Chloroflexota bacterium]|nr:phospholipid carrier-dependent glycosyltransferase [Chloroflexota bacterium]
MELPLEFLVDMEIIRRIPPLLRKWEYTWLCLLVIIVLGLHFAIINQPAQPVFDEYYYTADARSFLQGEGKLRAEHPPLGQLLIISGTLIFGDNPFGWRFVPVVFSAAGVVLFYLICRRLEMSRRAGWLATFLLSLENMSFVQGSVAMLDVFTVTFMLLGFWLYLRGNYIPSGAVLTLSTLTKLTGILAFPVILVHWLLTKRPQPVKLVASLVVAYAGFWLLLPLLDFAVIGQFDNPVTRVLLMFTQGNTLTFTAFPSGLATRPWDWLLRPQFGIHPAGSHYMWTISFGVWALIIPTTVYLLVRAIKGNRAALFATLWFAGTYLLWIPTVLVTQRLTYIHYFYPAIGAVCLGLGLGFSQLLDLWHTRKLRWTAIAIVSLFLLSHVVIFAAMSPLPTWKLLFFNYIQ